MINCRNCINWMDESLEQIKADQSVHPHIFMGCRIFGYIENNRNMQSCRHYAVSENLYTICVSCHVPVPKVCVSLGECANCTDTNLFCAESCVGGESRKYCTHFVRLHTEGIHLIDKGQVFDLFPKLGMPGKEKPSNAETPSDRKAIKE